MFEAGIIDPTKVTRIALENAASVAGMILTTECALVDIKEDTPAMPPNMPNYTAMPQNMSDPNVFPTFASDRKSDRSHFFRTDQLFAHELHPMPSNFSCSIKNATKSSTRNPS